MNLRFGKYWLRVSWRTFTLVNTETKKVGVWFFSTIISNLVRGAYVTKFEPDTERGVGELELHNQLWRCVPNVRVRYWSKWSWWQTHQKGWSVYAEKGDCPEYEYVFWSNAFTPMEAVLHTESVGKHLDKLTDWSKRFVDTMGDHLPPELIKDMKETFNAPPNAGRVSFTVKQQREQNK